MPIDLQQLGSKCRRLRDEILAMTIDVASQRTGITVNRLSQIEHGTVEPSGDEILVLADVYGEPIDYFVTSERSASIEKASDLYRMYGTEFSPDDRQSIQEFLMLCRFEHEIESLLGARPRVFDFRRGRAHSHMKTDGHSTAEKLRSDLGLGDRPINNPFHLPRRLGCHIFRRFLRNSKISGVMLRHEDFGPCILVNYSEDLYRQNFSAAHELCHALLDDDCPITVSFEREHDEANEERRRREWRANAFASHLLLPHAAREDARLDGTFPEQAESVRRMAKMYRVNPVVVLYALQEANRLSQGAVETLRSIVRISPDEKDDADLSGEPSLVRARRQRHLRAGLSPEYVETCIRAYREGQVSFGRLADVLLVSPVELPGVLSDFGHETLMGTQA